MEHPTERQTFIPRGKSPREGKFAAANEYLVLTQQLEHLRAVEALEALTEEERATATLPVSMTRAERRQFAKRFRLSNSAQVKQVRR